ncbi:MAG: hypothetical protein J0L53_02145 [Spirochaetes bacterium]|nr:hypothetical protein [Spirochaetota bacterium]
MLLEKIPLGTSEADFLAAFAQVHQAGEVLTFTETLAGGEIFYRAKSKNGKLAQLSLSMNGDFTESAYNDLTVITKSIIYLQKSRGYPTAPQETKTLAWKELIESPLPDTGDRSIQVFAAGWDSPEAKAILSFSWTWPGQLALEYKEDMK